MRLLGRLILVPLALLLAIPAGIMALAAAALLDPAAGELARALLWGAATSVADTWAEGDAEVVWSFASGGGLASAILVAPPLFVALVGEVIGLRALAFYAGGTGALTAALPWLMRQGERPSAAGEGRVTLALFLVGACAGLVYWLIAGRSAGVARPINAPAPSRS